MKNVSAVKAKRAASTPPETGHFCPETGAWRPAGQGSAPARFIQKGEVMPAVSGEPAVWVPAGPTPPYRLEARPLR
ncbi:MAG: hypothetical protein JWQ75_3018 [Pseudarthrobacter sp.]|nr:hypothetical protein [Pseudarthrobacter sp.]